MAMNKSLALKFDREKLLQFFKDKKNRPYLIGGGVVLLVAAISAAFIINLGLLSGSGSKTNSAEKPAGATTSVLPQTTRSASPASPAESQSSGFGLDPFAGPMELKGIMLGGGANDLAIIVVGDTTFVAGKDTVIADTWTVTEITAKEVILTTENEKVKLEFSGRVKTETTTPVITPSPKEPAAPSSQTGGETAR